MLDPQKFEELKTALRQQKSAQGAGLPPDQFAQLKEKLRQRKAEQEGFSGFKVSPEELESTTPSIFKSAIRPIANLPFSLARGLGNLFKIPEETYKTIKDIGFKETAKQLPPALFGEAIAKPIGYAADIATGLVKSPLETAGNVAKDIYKTSQEEPIQIPLILEAGSRGLQKVLGKEQKGIIGPTGQLVNKQIEPVIQETQTIAKNLTENMSNSLEQVNLRLTPTQKIKLGKKLNETVKFIADKKLTGTPEARFEKVDAFYNQTEAKLQKFLDTNNTAKGIFVSKSNLIKQLRDLKKELMRDSSDAPVIDKQIESAINNIESQYRTDKIPIKRLNELKRSTYQNAYNRAGDKVLDDVEHSIGDVYKENIQNSTKGLTLEGKSVGEFNQNYGKIINARKLMRIAQGRPELGLVGKLTARTIGGLIGESVGGPLGAAAGALIGGEAGGVIAGTQARSFLGKTLKTISEKIPAKDVSKGIKKIPFLK